LAVAHGVHDGAARGVDGDLVVVDAEAVEVGVGVGHEAGLEDFVWAWADAWDEVGRFEGGLFDLGVVVLWIFVEFHLADFDEGEVGVGPDFGQIERVPLEGVGLCLGHDLDFECPAWEVAFFDGVEEVALV